MNPDQFQHLMNMLGGVQACLYGLIAVIWFHAIMNLFSSNSLKKVETELSRINWAIREGLKRG